MILEQKVSRDGADSAPVIAAGGTVGEQLRALRQARGLTLGALARSSGVRDSTLSRWENNKRQPLIPELQSVLNALEAPSPARRAILHQLRAPRALAQLRKDNAAVAPPTGGELLHALRLRKGLTQTEAARASGVNQSQIARWENGDSWPDVATVHMLCWHLGASNDELAILTNVQGGVTSSGADRADPGEPELPGSGSLALSTEAQRPWVAYVDQYLHRTPKTFSLELFRLQHRLSVLAARHEFAEHLLPNAYAIQARSHLQSLELAQADAAAQRGLALARRCRLSASPDASRSLWFGSVIVRASIAAHSGSPAGLQRAIQLLREWLPAVEGCPAHYAWGRTELATYLVRAGRASEAIALSSTVFGEIARTTPGETAYRLHDFAHVLYQAGRPQQALSALSKSRTGKEDSAFFRFRQELLEAECLYALDDRPGADERLRAADRITKAGELTPENAAFVAGTISRVANRASRH